MLIWTGLEPVAVRQRVNGKFAPQLGENLRDAEEGLSQTSSHFFSRNPTRQQLCRLTATGTHTRCLSNLARIGSRLTLAHTTCQSARNHLPPLLLRNLDGLVDWSEEKGGWPSSLRESGRNWHGRPAKPALRPLRLKSALNARARRFSPDGQNRTRRRKNNSTAILTRRLWLEWYDVSVTKVTSTPCQNIFCM
jgi:hypothetical protein